MSAECVLRIRKLPTELAMGTFPHEQRLQPLLVGIEVRGQADTAPRVLDGRHDYEPLYLWFRQKWALSTHLFALIGRIQTSQAGLYTVYKTFGAQAVGI